MSRVGRALAVILMLTTIGCDQVTKRAATTKLADVGTRSYLADTVRLEYVENRGAFLGLGSGLSDWTRTSLLIVAAAAGLAVVALAAFKFRWSGLPLIGAALFIAGGASNLIDRIVRGSVVDFVNVGIGALRTGIFNIADVALMLGAVFIVFGHQNAAIDSER